MPTDSENLQTRRSAIYAKLAAMVPDEEGAGNKPNSTQGGIDHVGYKDGLYRELESINSLISQAEGPVQVESRAIP